MDNNELLEIDRSFSEFSKVNGVVKAFEKYLAEDATLLPNNNLPIIGKDKILDFLSAPGPYEMIWIPESASMSTSQDVGYSWGNWVMTFKNDAGNVNEEKGKYLDVWIKKNNEWKVLIDMSNISPK